MNPNLRDSISSFCGQDKAELASRGPAFHPKTPHAEGITLPAQARPVTAASLILMSERQPQESGCSAQRTQGAPADGVWVVFEGSGSEAPWCLDHWPEETSLEPHLLRRRPSWENCLWHFPNTSLPHPAPQARRLLAVGPSPTVPLISSNNCKEAWETYTFWAPFLSKYNRKILGFRKFSKLCYVNMLVLRKML